MADALALVSLGWTVACCRFHTWGEALPSRPVQDIAFAVARFFERGGSFQNYYMVNHDLHWWEANPNRNMKFKLDISRLQRGVEAWDHLGWSWSLGVHVWWSVQYHGGTNFGRTSDEDITTSYDYDAPLDEYGMLCVHVRVCVSSLSLSHTI